MPLNTRKAGITFLKASYKDLQPEGHFFDRGSMRFFSSKIHKVEYDPKENYFLFITSEDANGHGDRGYTVRAMDKTGRMYKYCEFCSKPSLTAATNLMREVIEKYPEIKTI